MPQRFQSSEFDLLPPLAFRRCPWARRPATLEGGGSSAPAPDPRLTEAQIRSMGIQDDAIREVLANTRDLAPLQKEQLQIGIDAARQAQSESADDRQWLLSRRGALSELQDTLVKDAKTFNTDQRREQLAGEALTDVNSAFSAARGQAARAAATYGVTPGSGRSTAIDAQVTTAQALAGAGAATGARRAARQESYALTDRATNALAGYPSMAMGATGAGAGYGMAGANLAGQSLASQNGGFTTAAQIAGAMGTNATGMFGAQQQAATAAAGQKGQMWGTVLGAGASLGAAYLASRKG